MNSNPRKVITGKGTRFSYVNVNEPKSINGSDPKYSVQLHIPKSDTVTVEKIKAAIKAAYEDGQGVLKGTGRNVPSLSSLKTPLRDGDAEDSPEETKGYWFMNANNKRKPGVVDADRNEILDPNEIYSGMFGRASVTFFAFNTNGNKGIACSLNNLQKISDGEPLDGRVSAQDDFADDDEDDFLS